MAASVSTLSQNQDLSEKDFLDADNKASNRRQFTRRSARWKVTLVTSDKKVFKGITINVSSGGMLLSLDSPIRMKDTILIETNAYYDGMKMTFRASALVCHCTVSGTQFNVGCQFKKIGEDPMTFLERFTAALA